MSLRKHLKTTTRFVRNYNLHIQAYNWMLMQSFTVDLDLWQTVLSNLTKHMACEV